MVVLHGVQIGSGAVIGMLYSVECLRFIIMNLKSKQPVQLHDFSPAMFGECRGLGSSKVGILPIDSQGGREY